MHLPSELILADALTKPGLFKAMMHYLTTGVWRTESVYDKKLNVKHITCRYMSSPTSYDEEDLRRFTAPAIDRTW